MMKKLTDELRNEVYKLCGGHILSEFERTIRECNMNREAANSAKNRIEKSEVSNIPEDTMYAFQLQRDAWDGTAQIYEMNLHNLLAHVQRKNPTLGDRLRDQIYGGVTIINIPKGTAGKADVTE